MLTSRPHRSLEEKNPPQKLTKAKETGNTISGFNNAEHSRNNAIEKISSSAVFPQNVFVFQ
jgi:hypothetical protein